jgi:hypothetical protein
MAGGAVQLQVTDLALSAHRNLSAQERGFQVAGHLAKLALHYDITRLKEIKTFKDAWLGRHFFRLFQQPAEMGNPDMNPANSPSLKSASPHSPLQRHRPKHHFAEPESEAPSTEDDSQDGFSGDSGASSPVTGQGSSRKFTNTSTVLRCCAGWLSNLSGYHSIASTDDEDGIENDDESGSKASKPSLVTTYGRREWMKKLRL